MPFLSLCSETDGSYIITVESLLKCAVPILIETHCTMRDP